jgi:hypothetical protein
MAAARQPDGAMPRLQLPGQLYRPSARRLPAHVPAWVYPRAWSRERLDARGRILWHGAQRIVGRAFVHEEVGLQSLAPGVVAVYLGQH